MKSTIVELESLIKEELKDCVTWYRDYLFNEHEIPMEEMKTAEDVFLQMEGLEPLNEIENVHFSAGYIGGLKKALAIYKKHEKTKTIINA